MATQTGGWLVLPTAFAVDRASTPFSAPGPVVWHEAAALADGGVPAPRQVTPRARGRT